MFQICFSLSLSLKTDPINVTLLLKYIIVLSACVDWNLIQIAQNRQDVTIFCYFDLSTAVKVLHKNKFKINSNVKNYLAMQAK